MGEFRFLVVEDEPDILEFNELVLLTEFGGTVVTCTGGQEAAERILIDPLPWTCVICDYKMRTGDADLVYKTLTEKWPKASFLLATAGYKADYLSLQKRPNDYIIQKPYDALQFIQAVKKSLREDSKAGESLNFSSIRFESLKKISQLPCDLFVKINDQKYTKVAQKGQHTIDLELAKYEQKGAAFLYCRNEDWNSFLPVYLKNTYTLMQLEVIRTQPTQALQLSSSLQEVLQTTIRTFGWSYEAQQLAEKNIQVVKALVENDKDLRFFTKIFTEPGHDQALMHAILLSYFISTCFASSASIRSQTELEILCLAGFLHDTHLDENQIRNEAQFVSSVILNIGGNKEDRLATEKHPQAICDTLKSWAFCPPQLLLILAQHHEKPDGKGFPLKLRATEISRLSYAFLVAHEVIELMNQSKDLRKTLEELKKSAGIFKHSQFDFYDLAIQMLEKSV